MTVEPGATPLTAPVAVQPSASSKVGADVGPGVGVAEGFGVGASVGAGVGAPGVDEGFGVGASVGAGVGASGVAEGFGVGASVGAGVGGGAVGAGVSSKQRPHASGQAAWPRIFVALSFFLHPSWSLFFFFFFFAMVAQVSSFHCHVSESSKAQGGTHVPQAAGHAAKVVDFAHSFSCFFSEYPATVAHESAPPLRAHPVAF